jgi:CRP/FNR family cyclic AMP-dependent transcriptional regulator
MPTLHVESLHGLASVECRSHSTAPPTTLAVAFPGKQTVFMQGDAGDSVFYIQEGRVRLTVVSKTGKEATLGILSQGEFFGEGCLVGRPVRMKSATTMTDCKLLCIDKKAMIEGLHREHEKMVN